jgi:hypothetical protein
MSIILSHICSSSQLLARSAAQRRPVPDELYGSCRTAFAAFAAFANFPVATQQEKHILGAR